MKVFILLALVAAAFGVRIHRAQERIPGQYIIRLRKDVSIDGFMLSKGFKALSPIVNRKFESINGLSVRLPVHLEEKLLDLEEVDFIEEDGIAYTQAVASWGLDRIDQRKLPLDNTYNAPSHDGAGIDIYIIDTGLRLSHKDFSVERAECHWDYEPSNDCNDCNGHGTHCGGTAAGLTYGVAPGATLKAVRVLGCTGSGSTSNVIAGIESVGDASGLRVGSMSLGGGTSDSLDDAVKAAFAAGAVMSVAAGNDNADACSYSPAGVPLPYAITVGATDRDDTRSSVSNYGACVDLFAPGRDITSAWHTSDTASETISGTSMACAHVSGCAALLLDDGVLPADVPAEIVEEATKDVVINPGSNSTNLLLYCGHHDHDHSKSNMI